MNNEFTVSLENKEVFFKINKSKYKIPSKMFPINSPKDIKMFYYSPDDKLIDNTILKEIVDSNSFGIGTCYSNIDKICQIGKLRNIEVEFYSGWIFIGDSYPIHHAWAVYDGQIIDPAISKNMTEQREELSKYSNPEEMRKRFIELEIAERKREALNSDKFVFGVIPNYMCYVGSPDTSENAKYTFRKLSKDFPSHPSYKNRNNMKGVTEIQEAIYKGIDEHPEKYILS